MNRWQKDGEAEGALDLIERAMHLLRMAPFPTLLLFYLGAIPYLLAVLFFFADMAASPFADERCAGSALGVALLYIWMRSWQAVFAQKLSALVTGKDAAPVTVCRFMRLYRFHLIYSSWALVLVPFAAVVAIPFGWIYAYFNNLCIVDPEQGKAAAAKARQTAMPWPKQNHILISVVVGFGYFILLNIFTVLAYAPGLLKSLVGIETEFARSWHWMGNSTFIGIVIALAYLVIEPIVKAVYVLRFQACESIKTGDDLLADLKAIPPRRRLAGMVRAGLVALMLLGAFESRAEGQNQSPSIEVQELNESVDRVMQQREFTWRMPREFNESDEEKGFFGKFMDSVFNWVESVMKSVGESVEDFFEWLGDRFTHSSKRSSRSNGLDPSFFKGLSIMLLVVLLAILVIFIVKAILARRAPPPKLEEAKVATIKVDLDDENVMATLLEEDEWIAMARELAVNGELRKATRAWFLAGLAFLSRNGLLSILHSKSNLDYRRELVRRARRCPGVVPVFGENIALFERAWYGLHPASAEDLGLLEHNMERMRHGIDA
jgi:hypothetical protein